MGWTYGGKLPSKYVIYAKIDKFDSKATEHKPINQNHLTMILKNVLKCAEEGYLKSIALPALGTGTLGYSIELFVKVLD